MRLIDADALIAYIDDQIEESKEELDDAKARRNERDVAYNRGEIVEARRIERYVNMCLPSVDSAPVVHAKWIHGITLNHEWRKCSECLVSQNIFGIFTYCPNCGAKMDGGAENV